MAKERMTSRQRVKAAINFQPPDRLPCSESIWPDTLDLWRSQGMPPDVSPEDYFDFDICSMSLDCSPRYEQKIISRDAPWYTYQDRWGYTATKRIGASSSIHFFDHKTTDQQAWNSNKHRWTLSKDPTESARIDSASYFEHFDAYPTWSQAKETYQRLSASQRYILFDVYGPWEATWRHCGYEQLLMSTALEPAWIADMAQAHIDLVIDVLKHCLMLGIKPDGFYMIEDLACNQGLLFSPQTWREIFKPLIQKLGRFLAEQQIDFWMHSCGNPEIIFSDLIECGLKVMNPLQASTGLNVLNLREEYGENLAFYGNISVPKMSGPIDELEQEIKSKLAFARKGGYVFHSDHSIPPDVSLGRYQWILKTARQSVPHN